LIKTSIETSIKINFHQHPLAETSRTVDFDRLHCGSENYCSEYALTDEEETDKDFGWYHYFGHLKSLVSQILIEASISCRILTDILKKYSNDSDNKELNVEKWLREAVDKTSIGEVSRGSVTLSLRESFNKLIHATEISLCYDQQINTEDHLYKFWTGSVELEGHHNGEDWSISIEIMNWTRAVQRFLAIVEKQVDMYHLYKYDS